MTEESLWITNRFGEKLDALIRKPDADGPFPVVLFVSGLGMTMHEWNNSFDEISRRLVSIGIMTLQFTFSIFDAKGKCRELPLDKRAMQAEDVLAWLINYSMTDTRRVGILAQSFGVTTTLLMNLQKVSSLIFVSGAYNPWENITRVFVERGVVMNYDGNTSLPRSTGENTTVGKDFWEPLCQYSSTKEVARLTDQKVCLIHGDHDTKIGVDEVKKVYAALQTSTKKLKIFKGGSHGITDDPQPIREEFLRDVVEWFKKTL
jgi:dipeptidyl aminopeptidase/acylaminoacyl peptidase